MPTSGAGGFWREGHGQGAGRLHTESVPLDEARAASPAPTDRQERDTLGRFVRGNTAGLARRARVSRVGRRTYESDSEFAPYDKWGRGWSAYRRSELAKLHGGELSAAVGAVVEDEGLCRARSRFAHMKFATTKDREWSREARAESTEARQLAKDAWQLAALEAAARPKRKESDFVSRVKAAAAAEDAKKLLETTKP